MIEIKESEAVADKIFNELKSYNDQFEPKVNYEKVAFYVEEDGEFIGGVEGYAAWNIFEISNIIVLKRKQGIGTKLIQRVESYARQKKLNKLMAFTLDFQAPEFYKKQGFETIAIVPNFAGEHACHYLMKRI